MAEVKWIKITTNMFEDEKIDFIESLPESDAILVIWIKLLTQAGKINTNGFIFLTEQIPYTEEMLSHKFRRPLSVVKLALETFRQLEMIEFTDGGFLKISNWGKHQNVEGLDKIREQTRKRVARYREAQQLPNSNVTCNVTVTEGNATELELEEELELDKERDIDSTTTTTLSSENIDNLINKWNELNLQQLRGINKSTNRHTMLRARVKEYGLDDVFKAIGNVGTSSFLKGQNKKGWTITFDWLVKPNNFIKVLEGNYTDKKQGGTNEKQATRDRGADEGSDIAKQAGVLSF